MTLRLRQATALALILPFTPLHASETLMNEACGGCHATTEAGLSRIDEQRKSPEGWLMTLVRMRVLHGAEYSTAEQAELVRYLSETQGLAPSEAAEWRHALEREPSMIEPDMGSDFNTMCARCHTVARTALQRRTEEEWRLLVDFHVGQYPTLEFQAGSRDRQWYDLAKAEMIPFLTEHWGPDDSAWQAWQSADKPGAAGDWVVLTEIPGKGQVYGRLTVEGEGTTYQVSGTYVTESGEELAVSGPMNFYSGYEWRANLTVGDTVLRQVLAIDPESGELSGRQFVAALDSLGAPLRAVKAGNGPAVLGTVPAVAQAGDVTAQIVGADLTDGAGFAANAYGSSGNVSGSNGMTEIALPSGLTTTLAFYETVDHLTVEPAFTVARVGGGGEAVPAPAPAYFKAVGFWNGADGEPGTEDDIRIGALQASWSMANHGEAAEALEDTKYVGQLDAATGVFSPAIAGPNPDRPFSTNNAGDIDVIAEAAGLKAHAQMIVTVQRFVDPPIR